MQFFTHTIQGVPKKGIPIEVKFLLEFEYLIIMLNQELGIIMLILKRDALFEWRQPNYPPVNEDLSLLVSRRWKNQ